MWLLWLLWLQRPRSLRPPSSGPDPFQTPLSWGRGGGSAGSSASERTFLSDLLSLGA